MAKSKKGYVIIAFVLVMLFILETGKDSESHRSLKPVKEEHFLPHTRQRRNAALLTQVKYEVAVDLNVLDVATMNLLRVQLSHGSISLNLSHIVNVTTADISTVCSPSSGAFKCTCEHENRWSCDQTLTYGPCDKMTDDTCGCINIIKPDGRYCQSAALYNFTACLPTTTSTTPVFQNISVLLSNSDVSIINETRALLSNIKYSIGNNQVQNYNIDFFTVSEVHLIHEYIMSVELNISDVAVINQLKTILSNFTYPLNISNQVKVYDITLTTAPAVIYEYIIFIDFNISDVKILNKLRNLLRNISYPVNINNQIQIYGINLSTAPAVVYEYIISIEFNISDVPVINTLRIILSNIRYPVFISNQIQIYDIKLSIAASVSNQDNISPATNTTANATNLTMTITTIPTMAATSSTVPITDAASTTVPTTAITITTKTSITVPNTANGALPTTTTVMANTTIPTTVTTTVVPTIIPTTRTASATISTNPTSTLSTTMANTTTPTLATVLNVEMSVRLDMEYTAELNDNTSSAYNNLTSRILPVLVRQYKGIMGFVGVFVRQFRNGSVIADFVVQTTQINANSISTANQNLPNAMTSVAPVIGSVSAVYNSSTPISIPALTYTGNNMTLTCGAFPGNINVGQISDSVWTFNGLQINDNGRMNIITGNMSTLTVNNVILADIGPYECTLSSSTIDFLQSGVITAAEIKQAPNVQLQSQINIRCTLGEIQQLQCCVQQPYTITWFEGATALNSNSTYAGVNYCVMYNYQIQSCNDSEEKINFVCRVDNPLGYEMTTTITIFSGAATCNDAQYGSGQTGDTAVVGCGQGQEGSMTAVCQSTGQWKLINNTCIIILIKDLLIYSQNMPVEVVPQFVLGLYQIVQQNQTEIVNSSATISAIVDILNVIANYPTPVNLTVMQNVLYTVDVIIGDDAKDSWVFLNGNEASNTSSELLGLLETLSNNLVGEFTIKTQRILLNRTTFNNHFMANLNSSISISIPNTNITNTFITTVKFSGLNNILPTRNFTTLINSANLFNTTSNRTGTEPTINAEVVLIKINATIQNVTLSYVKLNSSLTLSPECVFWNFTLFNNLGAWDDEGCRVVSDINNTVSCNCNHLTSFTVLMAPDMPSSFPQSLREALDIITYVGVGISLASLVICLIIEGYVWKAITRNSTAFMRHVSVVNTALSLLIADICFIIAASIAKNPAENPGENYDVPVGPCSTATFFMHFFYLALFFWMLVSGLLLFYRTVMVFSHMSKSSMLAIGFSLGYGCPLIIAVITVAVTAPEHGYIREDDACWLNWTETKALLALVIPALTIVFINILIIILVLVKMLRKGMRDAFQIDEKHTLVVVARCVIILTPLFGLTWSLGVGTMLLPTNRGIHIAFAFFNSLQGFYVLVFGTLYDSKVCSILSKRLSTPSIASALTRSKGFGYSSFRGMDMINRLRGRAYVYHVSKATNSNNNHISESYVSI